jgi:hypothetical protein
MMILLLHHLVKYKIIMYILSAAMRFFIKGRLLYPPPEEIGGT